MQREERFFVTWRPKRWHLFPDQENTMFTRDHLHHDPSRARASRKCSSPADSYHGHVDLVIAFCALLFVFVLFEASTPPPANPGSTNRTSTSASPDRTLLSKYGTETRALEKLTL